MNRTVSALLAGAAICLSPLVSLAHVGISSGPAFATTNALITFGVGHGCEGADTLSIEVDIPEGIESVRAEPSTLGDAVVTHDDAGLVTTVKWEKIESRVIDLDDNYYRASMRIKVPDAPFTTLYFVVHQVCQTPTGDLIQVDWASTDPESMDPPAATLNILPARKAGWNKFKVPEAIADLSVYFSDAQIVWKGDAAYSSNELTQELIKETEGVTELTKLKANDEIWVKY